MLQPVWVGSLCWCEPETNCTWLWILWLLLGAIPVLFLTPWIYTAGLLIYIRYLIFFETADFNSWLSLAWCIYLCLILDTKTPQKNTINLEEDIIIYLHQTWFIDKKNATKTKNGIVMDCPKIEDAPTIAFQQGTWTWWQTMGIWWCCTEGCRVSAYGCQVVDTSAVNPRSNWWHQTKQ